MTSPYRDSSPQFSPDAPPAIAGDTLAERAVAHWRRAKRRLEQIPHGISWPALPQLSEGDLSQVAISADGTRALIAAGKSKLFVLDLNTMEAQAVGSGDGSLGIRADGQAAAVLNSSSGELTLIEIATWQAPQVRAARPRLTDGSGDPSLALSPDGRFVAVARRSDRAELLVIEWSSDKVVNRAEADCYHGIRFSPDSRYLLCCGDKTRILGVDGGESTLDASFVTFSADGRIMARKQGNSVRVGPFSSLVPLRWSPKTMRCAGNDLSAGFCLSPDGRYLLFARYTRQRETNPIDGEEVRLAVFRLGVADCASGRIIDEFGSPHWPKQPVFIPGELGFSADGQRALAFTTLWDSRYHDRERRALTFHSPPQRRSLGIVCSTVIHSGENKTTQLMGRTIKGIWGPLSAEHPASEPAEDLPYRRPNLVRAMLRGLPADLNPDDQQLLSDKEDRYHFFAQLRSANRLLPGVREDTDEGLRGLFFDSAKSKGVDLRRLMDAARDQTHLLPQIYKKAQEIGLSEVRFGKGGEGEQPPALSADVLRQACADVSQLGASERDALFEQMLSWIADDVGRDPSACRWLLAPEDLNASGQPAPDGRSTAWLFWLAAAAVIALGTMAYLQIRG